MHGSNPNEAQSDVVVLPNAGSNNSSVPILGGVSAGQSMEQLPFEGLKGATPSLRLLRMQSIKSPFYKHPPLEVRRAQTP